MTKQICKINKLWVGVWGILLLLMAWLVKDSVRSPYVLLHSTESLVLLPPLWLLGSLWFLAYFGLGCAMGIIFSPRTVPCEENAGRYKGGMLLVVSVALSFAWYLLLFGAGSFFLSWIFCGLSILFGFLAAFCWFPISKCCGAILMIVYIGYFLLFILQLMVMLHI